MKTTVKVAITIVIILTIPISIYYGLRIKNTPFTLEYINRSYVVTLPNKIWFEVDGGTDTLDDEKIFENNTTNIEKQGIDFGLKYSKYTVITENDTAKRTQTAIRVGDTIQLKQNIVFNNISEGEYITTIFFSQYGEFENNIYKKDGCEVKISSEKGYITYDEQYSVTKVIFEIGNNGINDTILLDISCK